MKKMFLLLLCCPVVLAAQNGITISDYSVAPGAPSTVSFTVSWNKDKIDSAWVFVDYNNSGTMTRLPLSGATASAGSRAYMVDGNDRGAWVVADVSGAFSATVQLVATCRDAPPCVPTGACAYATNYPPQGQYPAADKITFTGTPPFYLTFEGAGPDTVSAKTQGSYTYNIGNKKLKSFTDATGAPGMFLCALPTITLTSGSTYQTVKQGEAIEAIQYTTTNATGVTLGGELPGGVSGSWANGIYTISGTISASAATQTYSYTVTPVHNVNIMCSGTAMTGQFAVDPSEVFPPGAGTVTWKIDDLTWSDPVALAPPACSLGVDVGNSETPHYCEIDGEYYYDSNCVRLASSDLCPQPWRLPSVDEAVFILSVLYSTWSCCLSYYCTTERSGVGVRTSTIDVHYNGYAVQTGNMPYYWALPVRCVTP